MIALSYSGENEELVRDPRERSSGSARSLIAMTGDARSTLAQAADVALDCHVSEEACPMNLVPTASTTAMLALGDALAMTVLVEKGFQARGLRQPASRRQARQAADARRAADARAATRSRSSQLDTPMRDVIYEMSRKGLGMTCVVDGDQHAARHHHRRRPAAEDGRPVRTCSSSSPAT